MEALREKVWDYYHDHGRNLPWRHDPTPYQVVISELMLQQTQVARVLERYPRWLTRFPSFEVLANASTAQILEEWQGMGYNRRALYLQRIAQAVVTDHHGELPSDPSELLKLPGIGPNTAGSIAAFAFNVPVTFIETNIRRVFIHEFFADAEKVSDAQLLPLITEALDHENPREWYYVLTDYGAYLTKEVVNPNRRSKHYAVQSKFEGSRRQVRGEVLRQLLDGKKTIDELKTVTDERVSDVLSALVKEGFVRQVGETYTISQ